MAKIDTKIINFFRKYYMPLARAAFFIVFFGFGFLKLVGLSPADDLARELVEKTIGLEYFDQMYLLLALIECVIGILFLIPKAARVTVPLLLLHLLIVSSPLVLVPEATWREFLVPTLEGQYIIKNIALIALAFSVAANIKPLSRS